jgi:hypothetical protein
VLAAITLSSLYFMRDSVAGGKRKGAGRPKGSGRYCEPTFPVRVPAKIAGEVEALIHKAKRKLPLYLVK